MRARHRVRVRVPLVCVFVCWLRRRESFFKDQKVKVAHSVAQIGRDVNVVTISADLSTCKPGVSTGNEWCVLPVSGTGTSPKCKFSRWQDLLEHLGGDGTYSAYRGQFDRGGRIGLQQNAQKMFAIYSAHLKALRELCAHRDTSPYGMVLEGDIDASSPLELFRPRSFRALMSKLSDASVFNFGPTTPICKDEHRFEAYLRGECFAPHRLGAWGAVAVGYNLSTSCSEHFLAMQDALQACVPSDVGLYSGTGGYRVVDSTLSMFAVQNKEMSSNGADDIHRELKTTYSENLQLWKEFKREGIDCESAPSSRVVGFGKRQRLRCNPHLRVIQF